MPRPKKLTVRHLPKGWDDIVLGAFKQGCSDAEVRSLLRDFRSKARDGNPDVAPKLSVDTWRRLIREDKHFGEVVRQGMDERQAYWSRMYRDYTAGKIKGGNVASLIFAMKNIAGWTDKQEIKDDRKPPQFIVNVQGQDAPAFEVGEKRPAEPARKH